MKNLQSLLIFSFTILVTTTFSAQINFKNIVKDFAEACGNWQGSLTYLDYSSGKPFTMQADLEITRIGKSNQFIFSNRYPKESNANSTDTITISKDGKHINQELVISRKKLSNKNIEIITTESGKDGNDNKPATIKHIYTFGKNTFVNIKEVQFEGEKNWIKRHEYSYTKNTAKE